MSEPTLSLFGEAPIPPAPRIETLPVSVIDVAAGERRSHGGHGSTSSRAEFSGFPAEVASLCAQLYLRDADVVFDPFAGWGERHYHVARAGKQYVGFDTSPEAVAFARETFGVENTLADSLRADIPAHSGLLTCPPYWNLERYAGNGIDRCGSFDEFCVLLERIIRACVLSARPGSIYCVQVGDWRAKGVYYDLTHRTRTMLYDAGLDPIDEVVVSRAKVSKIKVMLPQAIRKGYSVRVHESLLVYRVPPLYGEARAA